MCFTKLNLLLTILINHFNLWFLLPQDIEALKQICLQPSYAYAIDTYLKSNPPKHELEAVDTLLAKLKITSSKPSEPTSRKKRSAYPHIPKQHTN